MCVCEFGNQMRLGAAASLGGANCPWGPPPRGPNGVPGRVSCKVK